MITVTKALTGRYAVISGELPESVYDTIDDLLSCDFKGAEYSEKFRKGLWDGRIHMMYRKELENTLIVPAGAIHNILLLFRLLRIKYEFTDQPAIDESLKCNFKWLSDKKLYDYQQMSLDKLSQNCNNNGVIEIPTGGGKTIVALSYAKNLDFPFLVLVHRAELLNQWKKEIKEVLGEDPIIIGDTVSAKKIRAAVKREETEAYKLEKERCQSLGIKPPKKCDMPKESDNIVILENANDVLEAWKSARCCIAMVQTLHSFIKDRNSPIKRITFPVIIADECHTTPADSVYDILYRSTAKYILGITATAGRADNLEKKIFAIIGPVIESVTVEDLVDKGILARPEFRILVPDTPIDYLCHFRYCDKPNFQTAYRDLIVGNEYRNNMIAKQAIELLSEDRQVYVHVTQLDHGEILNSMIPGSRVVFGNSKDRAEIIKDFTDGKIRCLISTLLKEGVNIPAISGLIFAAGYKSEILTIQTIGRALRRKEDGGNAVVVDCWDTSECYVNSHTRDRMKTYEKVYGKLFNPKYIQS